MAGGGADRNAGRDFAFWSVKTALQNRAVGLKSDALNFERRKSELEELIRKVLENSET